MEARRCGRLFGLLIGAAISNTAAEPEKGRLPAHDDMPSDPGEADHDGDRSDEQKGVTRPGAHRSALSTVANVSPILSGE